jgi:hypothetical protein
MAAEKRTALGGPLAMGSSDARKCVRSPPEEMGLRFDVSKIWFRSITLNYFFE